MRKVRNQIVDQEFLDERAGDAIAKGFSKQKWVEFCEELLRDGFQIKLYEARKTFSKYLTVYHNDKKFVVRFSNHRPIRRREEAGDCDFFVGITHLGITKKEDAIKAVRQWAGHTVFSEHAHLSVGASQEVARKDLL